MNFLEVRRPSRRPSQTTHKANPLVLPPIVQRCFSYLTYNDLMACRNVNKMWNEESTKCLNDMVKVTLNNWRSIESFQRILFPHMKHHSPFNMFNAVALTNVNMSDRNIQISLGKISPFIKWLSVNAKFSSNDWRLLLFGQFTNLKELHISGLVPFQPLIVTPEVIDCRLSPVASTSTFVTVTRPYNPKRQNDLVHLTTVSFKISNRRSEDIFVRRFLRDLFSVMPNLQSLEWIKEDPLSDDFQKTMFDCLMNKMRAGSSISHLQVFKCPSLICGTKELQDISGRRFPLTELHLQISTEVSAHFLETFLESHAETLKVLKLSFYPGSPLNVVVASPTSSLVHLKEICLSEYRRSIGFVGHLPNLQKLTLNRTNIKRALLSIGWSFQSKEKTELSKTLTELYIFNDYLSREQGNCTREIVLKLAHCFPNLKSIRLEGLDDSSIRHLLKSFHLLEELFAPSGTYSDDAFRSYTDKDQLVNNLTGRSPSRLTSAFDASHLTRLRTLDVESLGLSDKFVTQGIINWRSLRHVSIKHGRIGFPTLSRMLMEMDLHQLRLQFCTILTDRVLAVADDPVEMLNEDDTLDLSSCMIQKLRFGLFKMLFVQTDGK